MSTFRYKLSAFCGHQQAQKPTWMLRRSDHGPRHAALGIDGAFELLNQLDGLSEDTDVVFVLTTNRPEVIEPALASRPGGISRPQSPLGVRAAETRTLTSATARGGPASAGGTASSARGARAPHRACLLDR